MSKVAIFIASSDGYQECWRPIVHSFEKFWPDCEWPRYIVTNYKEEDLPNTTFIKVGNDNRSWCNLMRMGLEKIDADYIIYFQEDYWINKTVDNNAILNHIRYCDEHNVDYLKIDRDMPRDKYRIGHSDYCDNPPDIRYSVNTAIAIWRKSVMINLMVQDWNGWYFERNIIPYIKEHSIKIKSERLLSGLVKSKGICTIDGNAIVRGVWNYSAIDFLKENGMEEIISKRDVMGPITNWLYTHTPSPQSIFRYPFWGVLKILKQLKVNW